MRSLPSFASRAFATGTVAVNHVSSDVLAPHRRLKCHYRWLRALKSSDHPSDLVAASTSTWSTLADRSSSMCSSYIAEKVLARELFRLPPIAGAACLVSHRNCEQSPRRVRSRLSTFVYTKKALSCPSSSVGTEQPTCRTAQATIGWLGPNCTAVVVLTEIPRHRVRPVTS